MRSLSAHFHTGIQILAETRPTPSVREASYRRHPIGAADPAPPPPWAIYVIRSGEPPISMRFGVSPQSRSRS